MSSCDGCFIMTASACVAVEQRHEVIPRNYWVFSSPVLKTDKMGAVPVPQFSRLNSLFLLIFSFFFLPYPFDVIH